MKIGLVNVAGRLATGDGSRLISALLKRDGHRVTSVYLSRTEPLSYERSELTLLDGVFRDADIVMMGVFSSYALRAAQVTDYVHERWPGRLVFWGGPHCVGAPDLGLRHADGICFSEGDEAVPELVARLERGGDWKGTPNFAFLEGGRVVKNEVLPPFRDLDGLPYYDYDLEDQHLLNGDLVPLTMQRLKPRLLGYPNRTATLYYMASRGCPHNCSYCSNCRYHAMWGSSPLRLMSVDRTLDEIEYQVAKFGYIEFVGFSDDDFFQRSPAQFERFAREYKRRIGLPFGVMVSARTYRRDKMDMLIDAGLSVVEMGVQSGSQRVLDEVFNRPLSIPKTKEVVRELGVYERRHGLSLVLDFIIDNPWETREDVHQTVRYLLDIPPRTLLNVFFLTYFPGTPVYDRAVAEGIIKAFSLRAFRPYTRARLRYQRNWEAVLILLIRLLRMAVRRKSTVMDTILRLCVSRPMRLVMGLLPPTFFAGLARGVQLTQFTVLRLKERKHRRKMERAESVRAA
jgi:anaerobic magnesium-protoporphyrin IX monomethyl ester cyclase